MTFRIVHLFDNSGELGRVPDGGIINVGGVSGNTFTVGGRALLFADGSSTDGSANLGFSLQTAYDNGNGTIDLSAGKNFVVSALNQKIFQVDAATGRVTITGDLTVLGTSTVIEGALSNVDQVSINPPVGSTAGLLIEPMVGITMSADLVRVRSVNAGPAVFTIDASGNTTLKQLTVGGTINGIDLTQFYSDFQAHTETVSATVKHPAKQISVDETNLHAVAGETVQEVIESIDEALSTIESHAAIKVYEYIQGTNSQTWYILHAQNSTRPNINIYNDDNVSVIPDEISILDANTVQVTFGSPMKGRAILVLF